MADTEENVMGLILLSTGERVIANISKTKSEKELYVEFPLCLIIDRNNGQASFYPLMDSMEMFDSENDWIGLNAMQVIAVAQPHAELVEEWKGIKQKMQSKIVEPTESEKKLVLEK